MRPVQPLRARIHTRGRNDEGGHGRAVELAELHGKFHSERDGDFVDVGSLVGNPLVFDEENGSLGGHVLVDRGSPWTRS